MKTKRMLIVFSLCGVMMTGCVTNKKYQQLQSDYLSTRESLIKCEANGDNLQQRPERPGQCQHSQACRRDQCFQQVYQAACRCKIEERLPQHRPHQQAYPLSQHRRTEGCRCKSAERRSLHLACRQYALQDRQLRGKQPRDGDPEQDRKDHQGLQQLRRACRGQYRQCAYQPD